MPERSVAGKSIVTRRAISDVVRAAVESSYGVTGFGDPAVGRRLLRRTGLTQPGIRISINGGLALDIYVKVARGVPVAEVARQVDSAVRYAVRSTVGVDVVRLGIHVDDLRYQPSAVHRAEAMERAEAKDLELVARDLDLDSASTKSTAAGETARRRRRPK